MKTSLLILISFTFFSQGISQSPTGNTEKKEIKLESGGYANFYILKVNPQLEYDTEKEYFWFNNFSGIQSTNGGAGGQLLHGKLQQFFSDGKLNIEMNFNNGLKNGIVKKWDKEGTLITDSKYENDNIVYTKFRNEEGYYIEWIGELFKNGSIKNVYANDGRYLLQKDQLIGDFKTIRTNYYPNLLNVVESAYVASLSGALKYGFFKVYYKNGQLNIDGNYENTNRIGVWKYYDEFGTIYATENYRIHKEFYPNGKIKIKGGEYFNPTTKSWVKHGYWWSYNPEGEQSLKIFNLGLESKNLINY